MIENMLDIAAPAEKVFDFVVDVRNEPMESSYAACGDAPPRADRSGYHVSRQVRSRRGGPADQRHQMKALLEMGL